MWWVAGGSGNAKTRVPPLVVRCPPDAHRFEFEVEGGNRSQSDQTATYFSFDFARVANVAHGGDCTNGQGMLRWPLGDDSGGEGGAAMMTTIVIIVAANGDGTAPSFGDSCQGWQMLLNSLPVMLRDRLCRGWRRWWRRARPCFQECPRVAGSRVCQEPLTAEPPRWLVGRALEPCRNHTGTTLEPRWNHARATPMLRPRRTRSGHYGCWKPYISMGPEDMQLLRPRVAPRTARA